MESRSKLLVESLLQGNGLYSLSDAAFYARIPRKTLNAWFFKRGDDSYRVAKFQEFEEKMLTFNEFVEALAVRSLRNQGFSLKAIFYALDAGERISGQSNLFTNPGYEVLADIDGKKLYLREKGQDNPFQVSGKKGVGQIALRPVLQEYLKFIVFNKDNRAIAYKPPVEYKNFSIIMSPSLGFGEPLIAENGYPARVLAAAVEAEGSIEKAAFAYDVHKDAIILARKFITYLQTKEPVAA